MKLYDQELKVKQQEKIRRLLRQAKELRDVEKELDEMFGV